MRTRILIPLLVLTGCSNATGEEAAAPKREAASALEPGQWEITREVVKIAATDNGKPALDTPVGTKTTFTHCVAEANVKKPEPALFAGIEGEECTYRNFYMSRGRINASLDCRPPALSGEIMRTIDGDFTADSLEATATAETYFGSFGDVSISAKMTGHRIGECPAA